MKYQGKRNVSEYIMGMSNIASKLRALKLKLSEDLLIHLVLISLPSQFSQFKISLIMVRRRNGLLMSSFHMCARIGKTKAKKD